MSSGTRLAGYAELHCHSNFDFLKGASHPEELIHTAHALGYSALAITDECSLAGVVRAHTALQKKAPESHTLKLIIGSEFTTEEGLKIVLLAPHFAAYSTLSQLITLARRRSSKGTYQLYASDLEAALQECLCIWFPDNAQLAHQHPTAVTLFNHARHLWIGIHEHHDPRHQHTMELRRQFSRRHHIPTVACGDVYMHTPQRKDLQDTLTAIRHNIPLSHCGFTLFPNAERYLRPLDVLEQHYTQEERANTLLIAEQCHFSLNELNYQYPNDFIPKGLTAQQYFHLKVKQGAQQRWPTGVPDHVQEKIEYELNIIAELRYEYYFLTVFDIVNYAKKSGILCQGRGSAANSSVCFCLFITEVDPAKHQLLFERFISKERNEPPDIDVDFEHERREEVIQYIYQKYGRERAALTATVISYRRKSAIRDVGKALDFNNDLIEKFIQSIAWWDKVDELPERLKSQGIDIENPHIIQFLTLVNELLTFPRHLSQHVGGFILSHQPLPELVPIENAAMPDRTLVQWDKDDIEALGLMKIDVLALGMLSAIRKTFAYLAVLRGQQYSMSGIPQEDQATYAMLQKGDSIGVFQVESRAQMAMLPRLKPKTFYDLVIEIAIVRPGPIQGNMVHPYLKRRDKKEPEHYESPALETILKRTLGVPIFQEQVIQIAVVAADFSPGEADQLRRSMASWKKKGELRRYQEKLQAGMLRKGYSLEFAERIIAQINGFGEYGFPESHAASFALLAYVSAWLKCHEPAAFCCGVLNSLPMGFYSPSQLIQDARRHDVEVRPIDVLHSHWDHTLEPSSNSNDPNDSKNTADQPALRLGLRLVKGLSEQAARRIVTARQHQPPKTLGALKQKAKLAKNDLEALANSNALYALSGHRHQTHWTLQGLQPESPLVQQDQQQESTVNLLPPSAGQDLLADYASQGLSLAHHPLALLRDHPALKGCKTRRQIECLNHKRFVRVAGLITGRQRPLSAEGVIFLTLEDETGNHNIVVWRRVVEQYRSHILQAKLLRIKGVIERNGDVIHIIAGHMEDLTHLLGGLATQSRDFH